MFASTAFAADLRVDSPDGLALSAEVFSESEALEGVYVASVPSSLDAELTLGGRIYLALISGAGRMLMPETMPIAKNMVTSELPP